MTATDSPSLPPPVTSELFKSRVLALLRPRGGTRPWPKRQMDRWILLYGVSRRLGPAEELAERDANARIQNWLLGPGSRLEVDFVTVRRALIDEGFWDREDGGTRYRRARRHERRVRFVDSLPDESEILDGAGPAADPRREGLDGTAPR